MNFTSSEVLLTHLNDILDFSKIENQRLELENQPVRLTPLRRGIASICSIRIRNQKGS